jgi:phosphatidylglycerophosphate synthase
MAVPTFTADPPSNPKRFAFLLEDGGMPWFSTYSYQGEDKGLLKPIRQPVCLWLVSLIPMWLAPHALTISGSAALIPSLAAMAWYAPFGCDSSALAWVSVACGVGGIVWDVLDNMDGPQARRTKTAGIMGDFLDHLLDYISLASMVYGFMWSMGLGRDPTGLALGALALAAHECAVYMTWWGRRFTKVVILGAISQDEAVFILGGAMFYSATVPPEYWTAEAFTYGGVSYARSHAVAIATLVLLGAGALVVSLLETLTHKAFPAARRAEAVVALWPLVGFLASLCAAMAWLGREGVAPPSLWLVFLGVSAVCWPLGSLQLLSALAGRAPSAAVNLLLVCYPLVLAYAHLRNPASGLMYAALALHAVMLMAAADVAGVLMKRVNCASLWVIPQRKE